MVVSEPTDTGWFSGYRTADTVVLSPTIELFCIYLSSAKNSGHSGVQR